MISSLCSSLLYMAVTAFFVRVPCKSLPGIHMGQQYIAGKRGEHGKEQFEIMTIMDLMKDYDWRIRPQGEYDSVTKTRPVKVGVNMYLRTISKVDDVNMEYSLHFTFREKWFDNRLKFNAKTNFSDGKDEIEIPFVNLPPDDLQVRIWMPDTFFQNEKAGKKHDIDKPNMLLRVYPDGRVLYSVRMTLTLSCPMGLQNYPLDTQECFMDLASYAYTTNDIMYNWMPDNPVQVKDGLNSSLPSFTLHLVNTTECTSKTSTGEYSCQRLILTLKREFSYYLLQLYIPSFMLVAVSWVSFWLDKDSVPARVTLGVTTLLTMTTQASGVNAKLPPVSYTKAIDVWIGVCLAFIFGALLEFALVNYAARRDTVEEFSSYSHPAPSRKLSEGFFNNGQMPLYYNFEVQATNPNPKGKRIIAKRPGRSFPRLNLITWFYSKYKARSKRIDVMARFLFPISFTIFNIIYWVAYLVPYLNGTVSHTH